MIDLKEQKIKHLKSQFFPNVDTTWKGKNLEKVTLGRIVDDEKYYNFLIDNFSALRAIFTPTQIYKILNKKNSLKVLDFILSNKVQLLEIFKNTKHLFSIANNHSSLKGLKYILKNHKLYQDLGISTEQMKNCVSIHSVYPQLESLLNNKVDAALAVHSSNDFKRLIMNELNEQEEVFKNNETLPPRKRARFLLFSHNSLSNDMNSNDQTFDIIKSAFY